MRDPVVLHRRGDIEPAGRVAARQASLKNRADVIDFQLGPREPLEKPVASLVRQSQAGRPVMLEAPLLEKFLLACIPQLEARVFAQGLVQSIAGNSPEVLFRYQRFVNQGREDVQRPRGRHLARGANRLDILQGKSTGEHA